MIGIGVDICEVKRFEDLSSSETFLKKVFTESEIKECSRKKNFLQCFASRFSAKEAFVKAMGTGFSKGVNYKEIELEKDKAGKPSLKITGETLATLKKKGGGIVHLSISHEKDFAIAFVVIEKGP
jgi:holo-[acyl-carrier protein] synthase